MSNTDREPKAFRDPLQTFDVTIRIRGHYNKQTLEEAFSPAHAYGPVQRLIIRREDHSKNMSPEITAVSAELVGDSE